MHWMFAEEGIPVAVTGAPHTKLRTRAFGLATAASGLDQILRKSVLPTSSCGPMLFFLKLMKQPTDEAKLLLNGRGSQLCVCVESWRSTMCLVVFCGPEATIIWMSGSCSALWRVSLKCRQSRQWS